MTLKCIQLIMKENHKPLKNKIYKHMTSVGKNVYFDVLDNIVRKCNNTVHSSIKMKPKDVTDRVFVERCESKRFPEESNKKDPKFKIGGCARISKYKNIFAKG